MRSILAGASSARWANRSTPRRGTGTTTWWAGGRCPIVDTWWQTETGGHLLTPLPGAHATKPGAAMKAVSSAWLPVVLDPQSGEEIHASPTEGVLGSEGQLAGADAHRLGRSRAVSRRPIFSDYKGYYFSGDGCKRDADGDYWITGPRGRRDQTCRATGWARPRWNRRWSPMPRWPKPPWWATRTRSRVRASIATSP